MKTVTLSIFASALGLAVAQAEPLVVGFERFHRAKASEEAGRLLYNELGCVNCHGGETGLPARRGPELAGVTRRAQAEWLQKFIANPAKERPGTAMPHVLPADQPDGAAAVVQYLASLKPAAMPRPKLQGHVNGDRGREVFHAVGCAACHAPDKDFTPAEGAPKANEFTYRSVAFPDLGAKYSLNSLVAFLAEPLKVRVDGRMPHVALTEDDATDIAGYLLRFEGSDGKKAPNITTPALDKALVERGRTIVATANCAACHQLPAEVAPKPIALKRLDGGCLDAKPASHIPSYDLSAAQRDALKLFLAARDGAVPATQIATLTLEALNCFACHDRDGRGGPDAGRKAYFTGDHNLGDTGRFPPPLTGVGRKLQPDWLAKVLTGEFRVRPYLQTKMPVYGAATTTLAPLLARTDERPEKSLPGGDDTAGRKLLGTQGGIGCITCHRWGEHPSLGIQGLDLSNLGQRIQPGWLRDYLVNPAGYRPGTLMPSFWPDGKASNHDILGGDTDRQIASIYSFAKSANGEPEGFPELKSGEFELIPKDRPIVQRTFLEGAGTHTILVGFPTGVHLAYDGKNARPAVAWQGKFFDAYNTWFSRFAPFEKPPGSAVVKWPEASAENSAIRFNGYRLDPQGVPTFLYTIGDVQVEERFVGIEKGLTRSITWNAAAPNPPVITHPSGVTVTEDPASAPGARRFTYHWK